jgi:hypothetical protein
MSNQNGDSPGIIYFYKNVLFCLSRSLQVVIHRLLTNKPKTMEDFVLLFRQPDMDRSKLSESEMQAVFSKWDNWFGGIAAQGKIKNMGLRLVAPGKVLKTGGIITEGPFVEIRERLNGFIMVRADSLEDAVTLAHGCPALESNGSVEIRPVSLSDQLKGSLLSS